MVLPRLSNLTALVVFACLALAPLAGLLGAEGYVYSFTARLMIFAIAALSLDLILGFGALVSLGHAAFIGIGAYAVGILSAHRIEEVGLHMLAAVVMAGLFGLATGAVSLRTKGVAFIMITLAFGQMLFFLASSLSAYGGDDGITLFGRGRLAGTTLLQDQAVFHFTVLGLLLATFLALRAILASRFGRVLIGVRENPVRMQAMGYEPFRYQLTAYVIAGMIAAVAGVLLAYQTEFVSPAYMSWQRSGELIFMVVLGGAGTLTGALLGAVAFLALEEALQQVTLHWKLIFGPLLVLVVLYWRGGLMAMLAALSTRRRHD